MKSGPLILNKVYYTDVRISASPKSEEKEVNNVDLDIAPIVVPPTEPDKEWAVFLRVEIKSKDGTIAPYTGEIENMGMFFVDEKWPPEQAEKLVYINGAGVLYASIREMVSIITSRGFFEPLTLPSCSFSQMFNEREETKKSQVKSPPPSSPNAPAANPTVI